jgi:hypothetical protein
MTRKMFKLLTTVMRVNRFTRELIRQAVVHEPRWNADTCAECDASINRVTRFYNGVQW